MADHTPHEKLTETVGVKLSETMLKQVRGVSEAAGLEPSAWIRSVIESAISKEHERYRSLHSIFGRDCPETKDNEGNRG